MKGNIMSTTDAPVIRLENVTKRFGREVALDSVSFEVPRGTVFALLGENGAGKTTAIRALLGLGHPDAGKLEVLGLDSRRDGLAIRQRAGCVFEKPTLYEWMTVDEIGWVFTVYAASRSSGFQAILSRLSAISTSFGMASMPKTNRTSAPCHPSRCRVCAKSVSPRSRTRWNPARLHKAIA